MCSRVLVIVGACVALADLAVPPRAAAQAEEPARIVASIGDFVVHEGDLDTWWQAHEAGSYAKARQDWYVGRRKALDAILGDYLLEREAASRKLSVEELLSDELPKRTPSVRDDEIREVYERSLPLPGGMTFDQVKPMVAAYLQQQHAAEGRARFVQELRQSAHAVVHLDAPRHVVERAGGDPETGLSSAPIQVVEFSDFECPYCRQLEPVLKQLRAKYADRLRLVWKDFPLAIHPDARGAAEAARCAADQGRFWEYHDVLFANQQALAAGDLKRHAVAVGLDETQFLACVERGTHRDEVAANLEEGIRQGVGATPTVFINGRSIVGAQGIDAYEKVILEELTH
jgi:protein-disulfide isomerase